jgi:SRSO17 transposase
MSKLICKVTSLLGRGNLYGFRNWVEYAFKQGKNELGWADFRLTNYQQIEKWWRVPI